MVAEVLTLLAPRAGGVYCDATLGAGGHSEAILEASAPDGRVIGIDRDASALTLAQERLARFGDRFLPIHGRFGDLRRLLADQGLPPLSGLVADLGVSSMQLDQAERGFSFQARGPIDMRMDASSGETALALIARLPAEKLADLLYYYGDERASRRIAAGLKQAYEAGALTDTLALAETVRRLSSARDRGKHPATRTFQALRIAVNDELRQLHQLLSEAPQLLEPAGRLVIITFHSLEDRLVKGALKGAAWTALHKGALASSETEVAENRRARSAHIRAARRSDQAAAATQEVAP
jgi:16S rRNA (cytosine1402-N4)-methyltransferase